MKQRKNPNLDHSFGVPVPGGLTPEEEAKVAKMLANGANLGGATRTRLALRRKKFHSLARPEEE
jgi:hypothetical protein